MLDQREGRFDAEATTVVVDQDGELLWLFVNRFEFREMESCLDERVLANGDVFGCDAGLGVLQARRDIWSA